MLKFSIIIFWKEEFFVKENEESFEIVLNIFFFQMKIFKITELFGRHVLKPPSIYCDIS